MSTDAKEQEAPDFIEEVAAEDAITSEDVLAYLKAEEETRQEEKETQQNVLNKGKMKEIDPAENPNFQMSFSADPVFAQDHTEVETKNYFVAIEDNQVPITDEDQAMYMKAMLNDTDVHLTQVLMGGNMNVECRAISVYEADMVLLAALRMSGSENKTVPTALLPGCAQQVRVAMQVTRINGKDASPIRLVPDRANRDKEINDLINAVDAKLSRMNAGKYGMLVRALNVFEHKLARMNALAYTGNFWKPVETD